MSGRANRLRVRSLTAAGAETTCGGAGIGRNPASSDGDDSRGAIPHSRWYERFSHFSWDAWQDTRMNSEISVGVRQHMAATAPR